MKIGVGALLLVGGMVFALPLASQHQGPLPPPPQRADVPASAPAAVPAMTSATRREASSHITNEPPAMPVEQIIQKFAQREEEFRMQRISLSQQDLDDLEHVQPFVLTTAELPKYNVTYVGREQLDELSTYVFDVAPKAIEKNQRYFQGRIWVDDKDLNIVKTDGKAVPDIKKKGQENVFPRFETFRENIEGHFWFPTYTRSNDTLHFSTGDVPIRMTVRYTNYKRFGVTIKIGKPTQVDPEKP